MIRGFDNPVMISVPKTHAARQRWSTSAKIVAMRLLGFAIDISLAVVGLGLFVYGDLAVHRTARIVGVIVTTVAVVVAAILASTRERDG